MPAQTNPLFLSVFISILLMFPSTFTHANIREGLVGWWKLDETSGATAIDWSGKNDNGTYHGTTAASATLCKRGGCRTFNGSSDYVDMPYANLNFERTDPFTISVWAKWDNVIPSGGIVTYFGRLGGGGSKGTAFYWCKSIVTGLCNANSVGLVLGDGTGGYLIVSTGTSSVSPNIWTNLVVTYDGSQAGSGVKIYKNGISQTLSQLSSTLSTSIKPNINWRIGDDFTNDWLTGQIDDVRVYNRVLTAQEVSDLYRPGTLIRNAKISNARFNQ